MTEAKTCDVCSQLEHVFPLHLDENDGSQQYDKNMY